MAGRLGSAHETAGIPLTEYRLFRVRTPDKGTRRIHVILYAKGDLRGATAPTDQLPIEEYTGRRP